MIGHPMHTIRSARPAFSLIELLIVISILGVMASVAIAFIGGNQRETIVQIRDQRNAQEIASLTVSADVCGADVIEPGDTEATIQNLIEGKTATTGKFAGRIFRISAMDEEEIKGAMKYLHWQGDQLAYSHSSH